MWTRGATSRRRTTRRTWGRRARLACAVPNALYLEHIPQLRAVTETELAIEDGYALAPAQPDLGIAWDMDALRARIVA